MYPNRQEDINFTKTEFTKLTLQKSLVVNSFFGPWRVSFENKISCGISKFHMYYTTFSTSDQNLLTDSMVST